ncbi:MAG: sugar phosphate nucleotidyltransferase [Pseudobdellovibrio sp.]
MSTNQSLKNLATQQVLILAGGQGTRLLSRVSAAAKPLAPVHEQVFLDYLICNLYRQGIRKIDLSLYHKSEQFIDWLTRSKRPDDLHIRYAIEPAPLGTAGAIAYCSRQFQYSADLIVLNGDTYLDSGIKELSSCDSDFNWMCLTQVENPSRFGSVVTEKNNFITQFNEKTVTASPGTINVGMYYLKNSLVQSIAPENSSLERQIFLQLVKEKKLKGVNIQGLFIDIGTPSDYDLFIELVKSKRVAYKWSKI